MHQNKSSLTLIDVFNFRIKYWYNQSDFTMGKIVFAKRRYVWYAQFFKIEIAYERFQD